MIRLSRVIFVGMGFTLDEVGLDLPVIRLSRVIFVGMGSTLDEVS